MNSRLQPLWAILFTGVLWGYGCSGGNSSDNRAILTKPPYAAITDSIGRFPQQPDLYARRAVMLSQHNQHELATADYQKAWELNPSDAVALQYVSNLLLVDKHPQAIEILEKAIITHPANAELHRRLSEIYAQTGERKKALEQYDALIGQDSLNFEAWFEKGVLLTRLKDTVAAVEALQHSYALQPVNYTGLTLATLYAASLNPKTISFCDELIQRDTTGILTDVLYIKGMYYSDTRDFAKAIRAFDSCIGRDWKYVDAYIEKGIVVYDQKKYAEARQVFTMAATVSNTNADAYYWMARCYEAENNKELAIVNYERALALDKYLVEAAERLRALKR